LFGFLLKHADGCWFASNRLMDQIGNSQRGDSVVPNGLDTEHFTPRDQSIARQRYGLSTTGYLVGYFGSMEAERGIEDLIEAIDLLRAQGAPVDLVLAGRTPSDLYIHRPGVRYLGNLPYADMPWALAAVDVVAVPYRRSAFLDAAASVKFGEIMACKRPFVATNSPNLLVNFPEQAAQIKQYLVEPGNPVALARAIARQLRDRFIVETPEGLDWRSIAADARFNINLEQ
jgi:glycosyltransferase involved in cell wall biosynthesis